DRTPTWPRRPARTPSSRSRAVRRRCAGEISRSRSRRPSRLDGGPHIIHRALRFPFATGRATPTPVSEVRRGERLARDDVASVASFVVYDEDFTGVHSGLSVDQLLLLLDALDLFPGEYLLSVAAI